MQQVILEMQYEPDEEDALRIPRPLVIPRNKNDTIVTPNFTLQCAGKLGSNVLEDEMFMSEIIMMAEDIHLDWFRLPLNEVPTLNILWEYGVCFPLARYFTPPSSSRIRRAAASQAGEQEEAEAEADENEDCMQEEGQDEGKRLWQSLLQQTKHHSYGLVFLHPSRFSMMLWAMDAASVKVVDDSEEPLQEEWTPKMVSSFRHS